MNKLGTFCGKAGLIDLSHFLAHCLCERILQTIRLNAVWSHFVKKKCPRDRWSMIQVGCLFLEKVYLFVILVKEWNSDSFFHVVVANYTMTWTHFVLFASIEDALAMFLIWCQKNWCQIHTVVVFQLEIHKMITSHRRNSFLNLLSLHWMRERWLWWWYSSII